MLVCETIRAGRAGDFFFAFSPGSFLSEGIAEESGGPISHAAYITGPNQVAEAVAQGFVYGELAPRLDPANRETVCFIRRLRGITPGAVMAMNELAEAWIGTPYDYAAFAGFVFSDAEDRGIKPNWAEDDDRLFCSEACATLIKRVEPLLTQPLPESIKRLHPSFITPWDLFSFEGLWETVCPCV